MTFLGLFFKFAVFFKLFIIEIFNAFRRIFFVLHESLLLDLLGSLTLTIIVLPVFTFLVHLPLTNPHWFSLTHDFFIIILGQYCSGVGFDFSGVCWSSFIRLYNPALLH